MKRLKELSFRVANAVLIGGLQLLHKHFAVPTTYKISPDGVSAKFEDSWFTYRVKEFGCTGNIDFVPEAENATRAALFEMVSNSQVIYDIGAHGGVYTLTLLKRFPNLIVHSFEPQPEELLKNLSLNSVSSVRVHAVAVGDQQQTAKMTTGERSSNHISESGDRSVRVVRLDDYAQENGLPDPDWIKIDIEGMELPALRGAEKILRRSHPSIICEINQISGRYGSKSSDLIGFLGSLDYSIYSLQGGKLQKIESENLPYSEDWNYWFLRDQI